MALDAVIFESPATADAASSTAGRLFKSDGRLGSDDAEASVGNELKLLPSDAIPTPGTAIRPSPAEGGVAFARPGRASLGWVASRQRRRCGLAPARASSSTALRTAFRSTS